MVDAINICHSDLVNKEHSEPEQLLHIVFTKTLVCSIALTQRLNLVLILLLAIKVFETATL